MRRSFLPYVLLVVAGKTIAAADPGFSAGGRTPDGDFDLEVELEVTSPRRLRGRIYLAHRSGGGSCGIEFQRGARVALFSEGVALPARGRERSEPLAPGRHLLVARRREAPKGLASFALEVDGRIAGAIYAPAGAGEAEYGAGALPGARIARLSVRKVGKAFFDDDFNWDAPDAGSWRAVEGEWDIATTRDAWIEVDDGPFATSSYRARPVGGRTALSLAKPLRLARTHLSVAAKIPDGVEAGIVFRAALAAPGRRVWVLLAKPGPEGKGSARLVLRAGSAEMELAGPVPACVRPGAWTRIECWSDWDHVRAAVAGRIILEADVAEHPAGQVGLAALGPGSVLFDDFRIEPWRVVHEPRPGLRVPWKTASGRGLRTPGRMPRGLAVPDLPWPRGDFRIEVRTEKGAALPVPGRLPGQDGPAALWGASSGERPPAARATLRLDVRGPHAAAFLDGRRWGESALDRLPEGPPGIFCPKGAVLGRVLLEPSRRPLEVDLFTSDFSAPVVRLPHGRGVVRLVGDVLRPSSGNWRCARRGDQGLLEADAEGLGLIWLSHPCPGDVRMEARVLPPEGEGFAQAGVCIAAGGEVAGRLSRYTLSIDREGGEELVLRRLGEKVAGSSVPLGAGASARGTGTRKGPFRVPIRLALERRGPDLFGFLDGELVIRWRDTEPLRGDRAGLFVRKGRAAFSRAALRHLRAARCDFRKVEPDWQPVSGRWLLHTGLACIPWDHWITAFGSAREPAYMELLRDLGPDVCVVARVSEAGEGFETKTHVHHPLHDVSVTLRGGPERPGRSRRRAKAALATARGYRVLIAPLPRKDRVLLFRDGVEVASAHGFRIVMGGHNNSPRQFTLVARVEGGTVSCSIDGREVIRWRDPDPLPAGRVFLGAENGRANFADVTVMEVPRIRQAGAGAR